MPKPLSIMDLNDDIVAFVTSVTDKFQKASGNNINANGFYLQAQNLVVNLLGATAAVGASAQAGVQPNQSLVNAGAQEETPVFNFAADRVIAALGHIREGNARAALLALQKAANDPGAGVLVQSLDAHNVKALVAANVPVAVLMGNTEDDDDESLFASVDGEEEVAANGEGGTEVVDPATLETPNPAPAEQAQAAAEGDGEDAPKESEEASEAVEDSEVEARLAALAEPKAA